MDLPGVAAIVVAILGVAIAWKSRLPVALAFTGALAFAPFFRISVEIGSGDLGLRPEDLMLGVLTLRCLASTTKRSSPHRQRFLLAYSFLIATVFIYSCYSVWSHPLSEINFYFVQKAIGASAVLFVSHYCVQSEKDCQIFLRGVMLGAVTFAVAAVVGVVNAGVTHVQSTTMYDAAMYQQKQDAGKYLAAWGQNGIGFYAGALLVILCCILGARGVKPLALFRTWILIGLTVLFAVTLIISYARTAIVGFGIALLFLCWRSLTSRRRSLRGAVYVALAIFVGLAIFGFRKEAFDISFLENRNVGQRSVIWETAIAAVSSHPMGYGAGLGDLGLSPLFGDRASAHNDWLDFALEIGVLGAALALLTMVLAARCLWVASRSRGGSVFLDAGVALFIYFFVCSMASQVFIFMKQPFFLLAGFLSLADMHLLRSNCGYGLRRVGGCRFQALRRRGLEISLARAPHPVRH